MADIYEVQTILADRTRRGKTEYKIRWKKYGPKSDSWEPEEHLIDCPDTLKEYKAQKAAEAAPTPRRSTRTKPTPAKPTPAKPTPKPQASVSKSVKVVKFTSNTEQKSVNTRTKKTTLKNDFVTPKPPRPIIRQRVLELDESEESEKEVVKQSRGRTSTGSFNRKPIHQSTERADRSRNRSQQLNDRLKLQNKSTSSDEGASWWIVALCVFCFSVVTGLIVWQNTVIIKEAQSNGI